ncbi:MAG: hypothetical protein ACHQDE_04225 [Acidimicrobiia bacterium]
MPRRVRRQQLPGLLAPRLLPGEELERIGGAWFARVPAGSRLLFVGRHYRWVALTDRRLLVFGRWSRSRRGPTPLLDAPLGSLRLDRVDGARLLFAVLVDTGDGRSVVLEFRPRERVFGREIVAALRTALSAVAPT